MTEEISRIRAVVVEDDSAGVALVGMMLRRLNIQAEIDPTGNHVVEMALRTRPHIIMLDLNLPGGRSGFDLMARIRSIKELAHIPIVALSSMDASIAIPRCQELGFDGFFSKPLRARNIAQYIQRLLDGEKVWDTNEVVQRLSYTG